MCCNLADSGNKVWRRRSVDLVITHESNGSKFRANWFIAAWQKAVPWLWDRQGLTGCGKAVTNVDPAVCFWMKGHIAQPDRSSHSGSSSLDGQLNVLLSHVECLTRATGFNAQHYTSYLKRGCLLAPRIVCCEPSATLLISGGCYDQIVPKGPFLRIPRATICALFRLLIGGDDELSEFN